MKTNIHEGGPHAREARSSSPLDLPRAVPGQSPRTAPGFVMDLNRCTGCQACVVSCWMEQRKEQTLNWRQVHTFNGFHHPDQPSFHLSLACHHCAEPACLAQCPAKAYTRDPETGAVIIHAERCMGCRYCTWACPYDAPKFSPQSHTIEKCTFCRERLAEGLEPACVARCPVEALRLDPERELDPSPSVPGFPKSDFKPGIRFVPLRREAPPELTAPVPASGIAVFLDALIALPSAKITLHGEWTLVVFTTILAILAAWQGASLLGGPAVRPGVFLGLGGGAMALSAWHLGHPERAWRAILNVRSSRLSREILLVSGFLGVAALQGFRPSVPLGTTVALMGFAALLSVDRIYRVALDMGPWNLHSGQAFLNGLYLLGWLIPLWPLVVVVGALKVGLYLHRRGRSRRLGAPQVALSSLRLLLGFVLPALLPLPAAVVCVLAGDLLDRCEFYQDLEIPSPQGELIGEAHRRLG